MRQNTRFFTHDSALFALFILGNAVMTLPASNANEYTFIGFITAVVIGYLAYLLAALLAKKLFGVKPQGSVGKIKKAGFGLLYVFTAVFSLFTAADAFKTVILFVKEVMLPDMPIIFIAAVFAATAAFFAACRQEDVLKFFLVAFWFVFAVIIFFFLATSFDFDLKNIVILKAPEIKELISQAKPYLLNPLIPALLLPIYNVITFGKTRRAAALTGYTLGAVLLCLCVIGAGFLFGAELAGRLPYPYSSAVSTVSIGRLFSRLDGFSYAVYFICVLAKTTVCLFITVSMFKKLKELI